MEIDPRDLLCKICENANAQLANHNQSALDIDFFKDLKLSYYSSTDRWIVGISYNKNLKNQEWFSVKDLNGELVNISIDNLWHKRALNNYDYLLDMFGQTVGSYKPFSLDSKSYKMILESMIKNGAMIEIKAKDQDEIFKAYVKELSKITEDEIKLVTEKPELPYAEYIKAVRALVEREKELISERDSKMHIKIELVPRKFACIEELQVWLDLTENELVT